MNLFPAVLIAGPPHAGKSVMAYHFSTYLKKTKTPFILLRTTPDGEGDWFLESEQDVGIALRQKGKFSPQLIARAERAIHHRHLPMLVDIGGRPQGTQFRILRACTHVILLYRTQTERQQWQAWLETTGLIPIAYLQSDLYGEDAIWSQDGVIEGVISGLDRRQPRLGKTFHLVAERLAGIFDYPPQHILARHLSAAPKNAETVVIDTLAQTIGVPQDHRGYWWHPQQISLALDWLPEGSPIALYGRGPVWLYAAIAIAALPHQFYLFDARHFGWMLPPPVVMNESHKHPDLAFEVKKDELGLRLNIHAISRFLHPDPILLPLLPPASALILDGKAPAWVYAALGRALAPHYDHLRVYDPRFQQPVLIHGPGLANAGSL